MLGLLFILGIALWLALRQTTTLSESKASESLTKYWQVAHSSFKERKYLRTERALLSILRVDERNSTAYNRLGILYAKQAKFKEAIECFEIAQSLEPNPSNLHNVGLIYFNAGDYSKAALAFEQALEMEDTVAVRYIAYAKVQEMIGDYKKMTEALEKAVELEENPQTLKMLAVAYDQTGQTQLANDLRAKANKMIIKQVKPLKTIQRRRVVM